MTDRIRLEQVIDASLDTHFSRATTLMRKFIGTKLAPFSASLMSKAVSTAANEQDLRRVVQLIVEQLSKADGIPANYDAVFMNATLREVASRGEFIPALKLYRAMKTRYLPVYVTSLAQLVESIKDNKEISSVEESIELVGIIRSALDFGVPVPSEKLTLCLTILKKCDYLEVCHRILEFVKMDEQYDLDALPPSLLVEIYFHLTDYDRASELLIKLIEKFEESKEEKPLNNVGQLTLDSLLRHLASKHDYKSALRVVLFLRKLPDYKLNRDLVKKTIAQVEETRGKPALLFAIALYRWGVDVNCVGFIRDHDLLQYGRLVLTDTRSVLELKLSLLRNIEFFAQNESKVPFIQLVCPRYFPGSPDEPMRTANQVAYALNNHFMPLLQTYRIHIDEKNTASGTGTGVIEILVSDIKNWVEAITEHGAKPFSSLLAVPCLADLPIEELTMLHDLKIKKAVSFLVFKNEFILFQALPVEKDATPLEVEFTNEKSESNVNTAVASPESNMEVDLSVVETQEPALEPMTLPTNKDQTPVVSPAKTEKNQEDIEMEVANFMMQLPKPADNL